MSLLRILGLSKSFGGVHAVQSVSLVLEEGEMLALIGPNGAGKSTTFNLVGGQLRPDAGQVLLDGRDITGCPPRVLARRGVARTFQMAQTFTSLSVLQNVQLALLAHHRRHWRWWRAARGQYLEEAQALLEQVGLAEQAARPGHALAYGDVKRLELALALAGQPRLLLMDEPTAGMAAAERLALMALVRRIAHERRMAVLFTEHSMDVVFGHADRVAVLVRGALLAEGTPREIRADARVQQAYLGAPQAGGAAPGPTAAVQEGAPLLQVQALHAGYGAARVLHGVSLQVRAGEVLALMGRNGAGKSTTLKAIAGLLEGTRGQVCFQGRDITRWPAYRIARAGLGYVPEERRIFTDLTVLQNLQTGAQPPRPGGPTPWTPERLFQLFPNLGEMPRRLGGRMSGGEQQMLTVARTLMGQPLLVLLDEPSEGVAPVIVAQMAAAVAALKAEGLAVVLSEQNLALAQAVADRVCVIEQGSIVHEGPMADFLADAPLRERVLGV